jgi:5-hydroxyisourate hydrolase
MSQITSHVLDTSRGKPAVGIMVTLYQQNGADSAVLGQGKTNQDGRVPDLLSAQDNLPAGSYRVNFAIKDYFSELNQQAFYPYVDIVFDISETGEHYHIPLLLCAFGYSTYRGS